MSENKLLNAALLYIKRGWHILPLQPCGKKPLTPHGCKDATTDEQQIRQWWQRWPDANIGLLCGPKSGVYVVDIDNDPDKNVDGWDSIAQLEAEHGMIAPTVTQATPRGGAHYFFKAEKPPANKNSFRNGIDIRSDGYYVVLTPSVHPNGLEYHWVEGFSPDKVDFAEYPDFMRPEIKPVAVPKLTTAPRTIIDQTDIYRQARAYLAQCDPAVQGQAGHDKLMWAATAMVHGFELDESTAFTLLEQEYNPRCNPPWDLNNSKDYKDFRRKVRQARITQHSKPRGWLLSEFGLRDEELLRHGKILADRLLANFFDAKNWPDPKPIDNNLTTVKEFDAELLPEKFRGWVIDIADRKQCPPDYVAVAIMVAFAAIVGRKLAIRPKRQDDWTVIPNLWGMVIGCPSTMKSPPVKDALKPLVQLDAKAYQKYQQELLTAKNQIDKAEIIISTLKAEIKKLAKDKKDSSDQQARINALQNIGQPKLKRYIVSDITIEALGAILADNPNGVLVYRDELNGLLRSLEKPGQEPARASLLEAWDGNGSWRTDRIGRGHIRIDGACISILGTIQPGVLTDHIASATSGGNGDDGLMQRFQLAVWPDTNENYKYVDRYPDNQAKKQVFDLFKSIDDIDVQALGGQYDTFDDEQKDVPFIYFDHGAQDLFADWLTKLENHLREETERPCMAAHLGKYRSLIPSLALLIHLADGGKGNVSKVALEKAIAWGHYLESHARKIYNSALADSNYGSSIQILAEHLKKSNLENGFTCRDIQRKGWRNLIEQKDIKRALNQLCSLDWLRPEIKSTGGRPKTIYKINPKIVQLHLAKAV
ncbi:MAG: DUF3987 domain-containing protein [Phycisphaerae bacterium]|nr:DUF3987 domain-containing protein [Phycisphaerae bacterium]